MAAPTMKPPHPPVKNMPMTGPSMPGTKKGG